MCRDVGFLQRFRLFATFTSTTIHKPCLAPRDQPFLHQRHVDPLGALIVERKAQRHRAYLGCAVHRVDLHRAIHPRPMLCFVNVKRHRLTRRGAEIVVGGVQISLDQGIPASERARRDCVFLRLWRRIRRNRPGDGCASAQQDRCDSSNPLPPPLSSSDDNPNIKMLENVQNKPLNPSDLSSTLRQKPLSGSQRSLHLAKIA
jgi:hypothetical protein